MYMYMYMSIIVICHWNVISSNALWGIGSCQYTYVCMYVFAVPGESSRRPQLAATVWIEAKFGSDHQDDEAVFLFCCSSSFFALGNAHNENWNCRRKWISSAREKGEGGGWSYSAAIRLIVCKTIADEDF